MSEQTGNLTFGIIKPDAVRAGKTGAILQRVSDAGFKLRAMKLLHMTRQEAEGFYAVHRERPFFKDLCAFMTSGPVIVVALERDNAVAHWRKVIGATDPAKADAGTIRKEFAESIERNATHGSDAADTAAYEIGYFFAGADLV